ncbi:hypothetical protein TSOC_012128 [Tetrabaena socialis]|uniref:BTB domain-containing protein n=1 Tax=Tetrabaena socialis TaxID=47790 RepID=A0A2J7ZNT3_9CHLO|nr:hypothetical protein TSOC_012128 [Tetrabaena socialis]|eukprot:PNH01929.1 hypothetical protein TSOC_012128 [Tetrabaena socialis]
MLFAEETSRRGDCTVSFYLAGNRVGDPLPAHRVLLCGGSAFLGAQAVRWSQQSVLGPELRVPLSSLDDLPPAVAALRFLYTGSLGAAAITAAQLLQVRRQAAFLLLEACVEACDAALLARITAAAPHHPKLASGAAGGCPPAAPGVASGTARPTYTVRRAPGPSFPAGSSSAVAAGGDDASLAGVAELHACRHLLPSAADSACGAALLRACRQQLAASQELCAQPVGMPCGAPVSAAELLAWAFPDAPSLLCDPGARRQVEALPAAALEALLGSDGFATDDEATVLLLLAHWLGANTGVVSAVLRERLCRLVRLRQLGETYLRCVLPRLPWFPIAREELAFLEQYADAGGRANKRSRARGAAGSEAQYDTAGPWYCATARPGMRSDAGRPYEWRVGQEQLLTALRSGNCHGQQLGPFELVGSFYNGAQRLVSRGFEYRPILAQQEGGNEAHLSLQCALPDALGLPASAQVAGLASTSAQLAVYRCPPAGGGEPSSREACGLRYDGDEPVPVGWGWSHHAVLPLERAERVTTLWGRQQQGRPLLPAATRLAADPLQGWGAYVSGGQISGYLVWE